MFYLEPILEILLTFHLLHRLYKVICENGAGEFRRLVLPLHQMSSAKYFIFISSSVRSIVIRSGIEVSTSQIGMAPKGTVLSIVGRAFSDHPRSSCIERLQLAGGRGWISARLTGTVTGDRRIVELVGLDDR